MMILFAYMYIAFVMDYHLLLSVIGSWNETLFFFVRWWMVIKPQHILFLAFENETNANQPFHLFRQSVNH